MDAQQKQSCYKKKKSRFFETYISKIIKQISETNGITYNAKQQLNSFLCIISKFISHKVRELTEIAKKKTLSEKEIINTLQIILSGQLAKLTISESITAVKQYNSKECNGSSRQNKAGIIFPPSITEKFLRQFGYSKIMVSCNAPVCLAAALEYITTEILKLASTSAKNNKRIRITIRDLELSVRNDTELNILFNKLNINFLGGGSTPFIHSSLVVKKSKKKSSKQPLSITNDTTKKTRRFRPGTVAIREIKRFQKISNCLTFAKYPFVKLVRQIVGEIEPNHKISKEVFIVLQYFIEQYIVDILKQANLAAIHAGRVKLIPSDIKFILSVKNYKHINQLQDILSVEEEVEEVDEEVDEEDEEDEDEEEEEDEEDEDEEELEEEDEER